MKIVSSKSNSILALLFIGLISCEQNLKNNQDKQSTEIIEPSKKENVTVVKPDPPIINIEIEKINKDQFSSAKQQEKFSKPAEKVIDYKTVQKQLAGIVDFYEADGYLGINKINFRNGALVEDEEQLRECSFVAYFPADDILLLEGGHTTDVSFNLGTGQSTYDAGNPGTATVSPRGEYRLNRVFEGQQCFEHFIQKKQRGKFQKIAGLNEIFEKKTGKWLCVIEKEFWTDDHTLYFGLVAEYKDDGNEYEYYKVKITDK
ncbi:hypothetical protein [Sphingobacterium chuzhouense]|uniref:Lipoprotein n=1 Tax=Sphingobacterium chuzhouense TaxID=1742264 RepID=A0ABR7XQV0_9SPHI|nr:hypothetical protein [Sphingobacterium chuzhouense]MBD1421545.1 hypothetical protein [Sphingobacterium chuzhouense]